MDSDLRPAAKLDGSQRAWILRAAGPCALGIAIATTAATLVHASWIAPQRPMTEKEWVAYEISDADAIAS